MSFQTVSPPERSARTAVDEGGLLAGGIDRHRFRRAAEHAVDFREFRLNALHCTAGQRDAKVTQRDPLLIRQHTRSAGIGGQVALLGAQQNQVFPAVAAHSGHRAHLHHIQHRRNGAHIILAQQKPQEADEMLRLPVGLPQHIVHLLQCGQQDFP